jgi:hypothetical protein
LQLDYRARRAFDEVQRRDIDGRVGNSLKIIGDGSVSLGVIIPIASVPRSEGNFGLAIE